ncbi:MAG: 1-acyl-sn-glycerol-3-phosphate acyltransferase [Polynucleobacter sp.]|nr:1-acyl-sn-glycerol-3-phosphate acyltransferase [Polynucleobacter sp.]
MNLSRIFTILQIIAHVFRGCFILLLIFPWLKVGQRHQSIRKWCTQLLGIFQMRLSVIGAEHLEDAHYLIAANHISWIDIHVINAFKPHYFVAKAEVASWPIFGWMAKQLGTLFIERGKASSIRKMVPELAAQLGQKAICIFPEGTSTDGWQVAPFKPNLFEAAIVASAPVYTLAIQYFELQTGKKTTAPAFIGDMGLLDSMWNLICSSPICAQISISEKLPALIDRKALAELSQSLITAQLRDTR